MSELEQRRAAASYQAQQRVVSSSLVRDIVRLLKLLFNIQEPEQSWPGVQMALVAMVLSSRERSASLAGPYYRKLRVEAGVSGEVVMAAPQELTQERLAEALDSAGMTVMRKSIRLGATPTQARDRMAVTVSGTATRLALEGGRDVMEATSHDDDEALGWARIGDGDPCSWCAMLISRGAVYESAQTAGDSRYGGAKYHDHDGCQAVPIFDADSPLLHRADSLYADWKRVTAGTGGSEARKVWRQWWEGRAESLPPGVEPREQPPS